MTKSERTRTPGGRRRRARGVVFSSLYAHYTSGEEPDKVFAEISRKENLAADPSAFAERLYRVTLEHAEETDQLIMNAADHWEFDRIALVDKNILRLAIAELLFLRETPPKTAINEAIELAREYSTEGAPKFINGILDAIYHQHVTDS